MRRDEVLAFLSSNRQEMTERFGVSSLALFGSTVRDIGEEPLARGY